MKCIIVDDEFRGREVLASLLRDHCKEVEVCALAANVDEAVRAISLYDPDIVFLDIELSGMSGFDLLEMFPQPKFQVVFVTSYDQYAIQAIRAHAFDYLLKPVIVDELKSAVGQLSRGQPSVTRPDDSLADVLALNSKSGIEFLRTTDIVWLKGDGNYSYIYTAAGKTYHTSRVLRDYEEILCRPGSGFVRTHKGSITNLRFVKSYRHDRKQGLILNNGTFVEVSRRKKEEVLSLLKKFVAGGFSQGT